MVRPASRFVIVIIMLGFCATVFAEAAPDAKELLRKVDRLFRSDSSEARITMTITTPDWERELKLHAWTKGMKHTFIRILTPKKDAGVATLRIGDEMWNYFPKINKVIKVPPSMMMGSWMGSDFTNDDLVHEVSLVEDYDVTMKTGDRTYVLTLIPKANTATVWAKIEVTVDKKTMLPTEQAYFDEKGDKVRTMYLKKVRDFGNRRIPSVMELVPLHKTGHKTVIIYDEATFDRKVNDDLFSLRYLQKK